ncbi:4462_t:CDS:2 [Funneliformis caledonium]|uniref:4462_t:CDS:1 n=1 Tax=Funneliformis caledonium TaxID=1117310 RepID=A0A9N9FFD5_9GLOM|nr:4462_t:CDS:2 [Funneliformis caledonium]
MAYYLVLGEVPAKRKLDFVKFDFSERVMILRNAIYDKKKNTFSNKSIDENDLILWKVDIPFDGENDKLKMLDDTFDTINIERDLEGKEMLPVDEISKYLKNLDKPSSSINILVQPPSPAASAYQRSTQDKVFKIPRLPGENEDTDIYNRECYKYLCNFILEDTEFKRYLITGNPGIGKTFFGRLMLIELLKKDKTVLLDCETFMVRIKPSGEITYVNGKELFRQMAEQPNVWCIIDGKRDQSSSKKAIIGDFAKQWCRELFMPTWNEYELEDCWNYLYKEKLTLKSLKDKFEICGQILAGDEYTHKLIHIHTNIEKMGYNTIGRLRGTLFEMVTHTIIRQGGDFRVRELTDDGKGSIHSFDSLEEKFFDNVKEIQG